MTLEPTECIRRCLRHVLPKGFHRIRHYGLFASAVRKDNIARARQLLGVPHPETCGGVERNAAPEPWRRCPCCGGPMVIVEILARAFQPRAPPATATPSARAAP
jgi:Putative transposase